MYSDENYSDYNNSESSNTIDRLNFKFKTRHGKLNLKRITSVDIDRVRERAEINEIQNLLDNLTFSNFTTDDVKSNTCETSSKVVSLLQLTVEYLLYSQEKQCEIVNEVVKRNKELKLKNKQQSNTILALQQDVGIYQNQVYTLKKSLFAAHDLLREHGMGTGGVAEIVKNV